MDQSTWKRLRVGLICLVLSGPLFALGYPAMQGSVYLIALPAIEKVSDTSPVPGSGTATWRLGLWLWNAEPLNRPEMGDQLLAFCEKHGVDTLLSQVYFQKDAGSQASLVPGCADFLRRAQRKKISVEALDGDPDMAFFDRRVETLRTLDRILDFQLAVPGERRFSGLHYDIEFNNSERWRTNPDPDARQAMMREVLETMQALRDKIKARAPQLTIAYDLPQLFGVRPGDCMVEFKGKTAPVYQHIQDLSDYVVVMSYRRRATGSNSVVGMATPEILYAAQIGKTACISLDTEKSDEPTTTFYGKSAMELEQTAAQSIAELLGRPGFGGLYLHDYDAVKVIIDGTPPLRAEVKRLGAPSSRPGVPSK